MHLTNVRLLLLVASFVALVLTLVEIDFSVYPHKLMNLDDKILRILNTSTPTKNDAEDLIMDLQTYVFSLGPLTNGMQNAKEVQEIAKHVYLRGRPVFLYVPIKQDIIQQTFRWTDNQMKVLHFLYDNAERHWNIFVEEFKKLNITI